jgi:hypothetical protein
VATPPSSRTTRLSDEEIAERLTRWPWRSKKIKDYGHHSTWCTQFGFYFSVPHDCTEADFESIAADLRKYGRKRNV